MHIEKFSFEDHFSKLDNAILNGLTVIRNDEPKKLRCGFIIEETLENCQYRISQFKARRDSRKIIPIEPYVTEEVKLLVSNFNEIILNSPNSSDSLMMTYGRIRNKIEEWSKGNET